MTRSAKPLPPASGRGPRPPPALAGAPGGRRPLHRGGSGPLRAAAAACKPALLRQPRAVRQHSDCGRWAPARLARRPDRPRELLRELSAGAGVFPGYSWAGGLWGVAGGHDVVVVPPREAGGRGRPRAAGDGRGYAEAPGHVRAGGVPERRRCAVRCAAAHTSHSRKRERSAPRLVTASFSAKPETAESAEEADRSEARVSAEAQPTRSARPAQAASEGRSPLSRAPPFRRAEASPTVSYPSATRSSTAAAPWPWRSRRRAGRSPGKLCLWPTARESALESTRRPQRQTATATGTG